MMPVNVSAAEDLLLSEQEFSGDYEYTVDSGKAMIVDYRGSGGDITIPSKLGGVPVTEIYMFAFQGDEITSLTLPSTVTAIDDYAFSACHDLKSVKWSSNLKRIGNNAFEECTSLTVIDLPSKLEEVGPSAFYNCTSAVSVTIPKSAKYIYNGAFSNTVNLKELNYNAKNCLFAFGSAFDDAGKKSGSVKMNVGNGCETIPEWLFYTGTESCARITELNLSDSVKSIGPNSFINCKKLSKISWGSGLETIGQYAFANCTALKKISFPEGLKSIDNYAFANDTGITEVILPPSVTTAIQAFRACKNLKNVVVYGDTVFDDNDFYDAAYGVTIYCYSGTQTEQMAYAAGYNIDYLIYPKYFTDVPPTHSYQKAVYECVDLGIIAGYKDGSFGINKNVTRGQVMVMLWRLANKPEPMSMKQKFSDVPPDHNYFKAIQWGVEQNITGGYSGSRKGQFGPGDNCTRGQIVTFLWRFTGKPDPMTSGQSFTDVPTDHSFYKPVQWASETGIAAGYKDGSFGINKTCTRGHCVTFIYRMIKNYGS